LQLPQLAAGTTSNIGGHRRRESVDPNRGCRINELDLKKRFDLKKDSKNNEGE